MTRPDDTPARLPIPPLDDTCQRYLQQLRPLLDDDAFARTQQLVQRFATQEGPVLQAALQAFDADMARQDRSWLSDAWLESYLRIRSPLPLASNIGLAVPMHGRDLADWVATLAAVCADHHHRRLDTPRAPSGTPMCMAQWQILRGAARQPRTTLDDYRLANPPGRHVGVLHNGFYYRLAVLDEHGEALPADRLRGALAAIRADDAQNPSPVAIPCYLGSEAAAPLLASLAASHPDNARLLGWIDEDLFHVCLRDEAADADTELAHASFVPAQDVWCYKPISLIHNAATGRLHLHCEHSWEDGGTLLGILTQVVQRWQPAPTAGDGPSRSSPGQPADRGSPSERPGHADTSPVAADGADESPTPDRTDVPPHDDAATWRLGWQLAPQQQQAWSGWQTAYATQAAAVRIDSLLVPVGPDQVPKGVSHDALMQFLLQYAQLATWGRLRNTYEAVDASHFLRGRTECVRPVSTESRAFVTSLLAGAADMAALEAALAEHKARIRLCKQGQGVNRHLLGLQLMARRQGLPMPALFDDPGYKVFTTDFLSTSTLGRDDIVRNFGFAPTAEGGLGINYTRTADGWLYTISHVDGAPGDTAPFMQALREGGARLLALLSERR